LILTGSKRGLLIWDSASTHRAKEMKEFLQAKRIDQVMIPAEMTCYLQSLDLCINKPFKDQIKVQVNANIGHRMVKNKRNTNIKPSLSEVIM
jgi:DDE superfamily endonuclease